MSVIINSGVLGTASYVSSLTSGPLTVNTPANSVTGGVITIQQVSGLQAILDSKLNDATGAVGQAYVTAGGNDLNLLTGMSAFGLTLADFQKLSQVNATAAEINHLIGVVGPIQTQINLAYSAADFTAADQIIISTGAGAGALATFGAVLDGTFGDGYQFNDLLPSTGSLDFNSQRAINLDDPVDDQDAATKAYVDTAVSSGSGYLPLAGGTMSGNINLDDNSLEFIADGSIALIADGTTELILNVGDASYSFGEALFHVGGARVVGAANPLDPQDLVTLSTLTSGYLPLSGGSLSGDLEMGSHSIFFGVGNNSSIEPVGDAIAFYANAGAAMVLDDDLNMQGTDISGLPAIPATMLSAITQTFADANYLQVDGGNALTGALNFGGLNVTNLGAPTLGTHIGTRSYNDARYLSVLSNLSDLDDVGEAITNLGLATVATSGSYNDLDDLPSLRLQDLTDVNMTPGAPENGYLVTWDFGTTSFILAPKPITSVFGRTGVVISVAGDYTAAQITNVPGGTISAITVQAALNELDTEKFARDGSQTMLGALNMNGNLITNVGLPLTIGDHQWATGSYSSGLLGGGFLIRTSATPSAAAPTYAFAGNTSTGHRLNGSSISFSVNGVDQLTISANQVDMASNLVTNVADPVSNGDAVNLGYIRGLGIERVLGSVTGVNLMTASPAGIIPIYTLASGAMHLITKVIVVATSYVPGGAPVAPTVSIGIGGPGYNQIVDDVALSWGPGGSSDQAVYLTPKQGAATPNALNTVSLQTDSIPAGTFSALTVSIYVMGVEL